MEMMNPCLERSALPLDGPPSAPLLPMEVFDSLSLLAATSLQTGLRQPDAEIGTMTVPNIIRPLSSTAMPISSAWRPWVAPPQVRRRPLALVNASPMRSMPFAHSPVSLAPSVCGYPRINSTSLPASPVPKHARRLSVRSAALRRHSIFVNSIISRKVLVLKKGGIRGTERELYDVLSSLHLLREFSQPS